MYQAKGSLASINAQDIERIIVFGDIHGDFDSFEQGISMWNDDDLLLFLGDYADRGPEGIEVIEEILGLLDAHPDRVIALKGNHEDYDKNGNPRFSPCTLIREAETKRRGWKTFQPTFYDFTQRLYLSAIIPDRALFVHGGIHTKIDGIDDLIEPDDEVRTSILWSDPGKHEGEQLNSRGAGTVFGSDVTEEVLARLGVHSLFRSHEPRKARRGPAVEHGGTVITTGSTRVYGGRPFVMVLNPNRSISDQIAEGDCVRFLDE
jgi:3',5'-cyclic AMP phosphodiesterase CpdA